MTVVVPSSATLDKYGLTEESWLAILERQGGVCAICRKVPSTGRFVTDHEHVRGYKKLPPAERARHVRGITCWFCNHAYLARGITAAKAQNVFNYLVTYEQRKLIRDHAASGE